jgi:aspartate beta-hydroxylase
VTESQLKPSTPELLAQFRQALGARQFDLAERVGEVISVRDPGNEDVIGFLVARSLARQDTARALRLGQAAVQSRPASARLHFHLGSALAADGDFAAAALAFRQARERDPTMMVAALWQADQELALGDEQAALRSQMQALNIAERGGLLTGIQNLAPPVRERVERAIERVQQARQSHIEAALEPSRKTYGDNALARIDRGLQRVYGQEAPRPSHPLQQPTLLWLPDLPDQAWFERDQFPFLKELEQATAVIRDELLGVLDGDDQFSPYVDMPENAPGNTIFAALNHSRDWSAYHLYRHGERVEAHCRRCPKTVALMESLPIMRIPDHSPEILFSQLRPKTHIPPHTGVINGRLTVHLPLIVPEDCGALRAGDEMRPWRVGECLIFDDSFVHEAWNQSEQTRVVLIFDIWHPALTEAERAGLGTAIAALGEFHRRHGGEDVTHESN